MISVTSKVAANVQHTHVRGELVKHPSPTLVTQESVNKAVCLTRA
jgi:hypothetical protein